MTARQISEHEGYVSARAAAEFLGIEYATLAQWRFREAHPDKNKAEAPVYRIPSIRLGGGKRGGRRLYRKRDLIAFMESQGAAR